MQKRTFLSLLWWAAITGGLLSCDRPETDLRPLQHLQDATRQKSREVITPTSPIDAVADRVWLRDFIHILPHEYKEKNPEAVIGFMTILERLGMEKNVWIQLLPAGPLWKQTVIKDAVRVELTSSELKGILGSLVQDRTLTVGGYQVTLVDLETGTDSWRMSKIQQHIKENNPRSWAKLNLNLIFDQSNSRVRLCGKLVVDKGPTYQFTLGFTVK